MTAPPSTSPPPFGRGPLQLVVELDAARAPAPADEMAERLAALDAVAAGRSPGQLRVRVPAATAAFSGRDVHLPGHPAAAAAAAALGFAPVRRPVGGRLAVWHPGCLLLDVVTADPAARERTGARFDAVAAALAAGLRALGADARVGPVPGEYCPGEHSVAVAGRTKVVGVAQRVVRGASLVAAVVVVTGGAAVRSVVAAAYPLLGLPVDAASAGALEDHLPGVTPAAAAPVLVAALAGVLPGLPGVLPPASSAMPPAPRVPAGSPA